MRLFALCAVAVLLATASSNGDEAKRRGNQLFRANEQVKELPGYMPTVKGDIVCLGGK